MSTVRRVLYGCGILAVAGTLTFGQSMLEHMSAAAGGSAAGVAGKSVSEGIDKVFSKLDKTMQKAEATDAKSAKKDSKDTKAKTAPPPADTTVPNHLSAPAFQSGKSRQPPAIKETAEPAVEQAAMPVLPKQRKPEIPPVTPAQIAQVHMGAERQEVLNQLGRPSSRITIPDNGQLVEIYRYNNKSEFVGSLRLTDGVVSSVRINNN